MGNLDGQAGSWLRSTLTGWQKPTLRPVDNSGEGAEGLVGFVLAAAMVGALTGLAAASFRLLLDQAAKWRESLSGWANGTWWGLIVVVLICAVCTAVAASLVARVEPNAEGSGIPRVEAVVEGRAQPGRFRILPIKYVGGLLSLGSGLALGREGPSVQMGGSIAVIVASVTRRSQADLRILAAGGAAAGLATAFNAPIAGGVFVLEELVKRFDPRTTLATLVASASGFMVAYPLVHSGTDFHMPQLAEPRLGDAGWVVVAGVVTGVLAVLYNKAIMFGLHKTDTSRWPVEARAAVIGGSVGILVWCAPDLAGGGDNLTQQALLGHGTTWVLIGVLALRFLLGVASYAAGTPGGLFAPMLVLGADTGLIVALVAAHFMPHAAPDPAALALIGMAAFFTASVHAPVTGLILATELTGVTNQLPPMLGACATALLVAMVLRSQPIYGLLADRAATRT
ncbi:ClC family H(+)/Cl(-) exchange transporter [Mycobacterium dioxanotrophicus]|uniref:ClC family H(+)/Cl(-) exchange transporter n=1 Tax=Mycobacterium dioxanotrophicus TaxID=482462 RepID=A0A1Y0C9S2_9MYCO|nr:ClC family H(+)/Cl(-) exchange transporter [Mycobacterium dioxanotrophicus]ART71837.1 ClC family H(+)/Cl(-) exchange transporter [Mycobacterium dioxanotrophicus]